MSKSWRCIWLTGALLAACTPETGPTASVGGQIAYIRHARTEMRTEPTVEDLSDCSWQRNLNTEGRRQAVVVGDEVRRLGLRIDTVLSSGFCRAKQTAELAFGRFEIWHPLTYHATQSPAQHRDNVAAVRARLGQPVPAGTLLVLVGHEPGLRDAIGIALGEGETVILQPTENSSVVVLRHLPPP